MISLFNRRGRILFFPKKWANSIVRWIAGVHSPQGTIKIKNTMEPGDNGSIELDVNMEAVRKDCIKAVDGRPITPKERTRFDTHLRGKIDGSSLIMKGNHMSVSDEWVENKCREFVKDDVTGQSGGADDHSDANADDDQNGSTWTWLAGGDNRLIVTPYCEIVNDDGWHYFGKVRFTYSKAGQLVKAEGLAGRKEVQA